MTHKEILEKILHDRHLSKNTLAEQIGYSKTNYSKLFNKDLYSTKVIREISKVLDIDPSVFTLKDDQVEYGTTKTTDLNVKVIDNKEQMYKLLLDEKDKLIAEKDEVIKLLKDKIKDMEK